MTAPLIVTSDETLLDELLRLTAAAGVTPEVAPDAGVALRAWANAPLILVGLDQAPALARLRPPRHEQVLVVTWGGADSGVFKIALGLGAREVAELPAAESWLSQALTELEDPVSVRAPVLGVLGGSGGAGATTFACALGQVAARDGTALLLDLDPRGPGLDRVLGIEGRAGVRWQELSHSTGRLGARALREAVPGSGRLGVLTWSPENADELRPGATREVLDAARRGHDLVVLDLPRSSDGLTDELVARCDDLIVVARASVLSVTAAARSCARYSSVRTRLLLRGRGVSAADAGAATGVDEVIAMADQRRLDEAIDLGLGPVRSARSPLARAAAEVLSGLSRRAVAA